jgi:hypothetical protein
MSAVRIFNLLLPFAEPDVQLTALYIRSGNYAQGNNHHREQNEGIEIALCIGYYGFYPGVCIFVACFLPVVCDRGRIVCAQLMAINSCCV